MRDLQQLLDELKDMSFFNPGEMCIIGCSTSEVIGKRIGSVGSMDVAKEVTVVPDVHAGGSLSTYAYQQMEDPIVVEHITVSKGIDIGQTLIGMHIKHVCVPVRTSVKQIGEAIVTIATSRPKKIGGERAKYQ